MTEPKTMAERHSDEILSLINACEDGLEPHKALALWDERRGLPRPLGHNPNSVAHAHRAITHARAACSKEIAAACERHRAEANAPEPFHVKEPQETMADIAVVEQP